jgi:hypothetical protein
MSNLHPDLDDDQLHVAKGFASASDGDGLWRDEKGGQNWDNRVIYPQALAIASSYDAPPSENYLDIYLLDGTANHADWDDIPADSWARYDGTTWYGISPEEGNMCYNKETHEVKIYDGTSWDNNYTSSNPILYNSTDDNATTAVITEEALGSYIFNGQLMDVGDRVHIRALFICASNVNSKTVRVKIPNSTFSYTTTTSGDIIVLDLWIEYLSSTAYQALAYINATSASKPIGFADDTTIDWSSATFIATGQNGVASANDIVLSQFLVEQFKINV